MKTSVIISTIGGYKDAVVNGTYFDKDKNVFIILQPNGEVIEHKIQNDKDAKGGLPFYTILKFNKTSDRVTIKYENDKDKQSILDKLNERKVSFWSKHPLFTVNGKAHGGTVDPQFNVDITSSRILKQALDVKKKGLVFNRVNNMSLAEKRNVSYFFGTTPAGKTDLELLVLLADFNTGICMHPDKIEDFIRVFETNVSSQDEIRIVLYKAIRLGVITNRQKDGRDNYYLGDAYLGSLFDDLLTYATREEVIYRENIRREVAKLDKYIEEEEASEYENAHTESTLILKKNGAPKETKTDPDGKVIPDPQALQALLKEKEELIAKAKKYRIPGYHLMKMDALRRNVLNAEAKEAVVK